MPAFETLGSRARRDDHDVAVESVIECTYRTVQKDFLIPTFKIRTFDEFVGWQGSATTENAILGTLALALGFISATCRLNFMPLRPMPCILKVAVTASKI